MPVVKLKVTATAIIEVDSDDAVDYEELEEFVVLDSDVPPTQEAIAIAMVKWDDEEDTLSMDEWDWTIKEIEVVK